jgi:acetyl-CoA carboxylase carboxyltransferase component
VGEIDGRRVAICSYDFTVLAGSMGAIGEHKTARMRELAIRQRIPMIWLLDSAGARIHQSTGSTFAGAGALFREQVTMSGVVPMVAAMLGHCAAGTAYIPALADFVPMVKGTSSMALGGRHLVKAATGEDVTEEEMGGSGVHNRISGVADLEVADDAECLRVVRRYLSYFPSHNREAPPRRAASDPVDRRCEELYDIVPTAPRRAYDMQRVVHAVVDDGEFFPMKPDWARNVITGFARFGGQPVGIVASQPKVLGGTLDVNSADKAARFVWLCDAFGLPLVFLQDVPGFTVGSAVEKQGIIRHGAKMLFAVSEATVPKVTVVLRKAYGAGYFVMNGTAYEADYIVAWPTAEIAVMGPDGMVNIIMRRQLEAIPEGEQRTQARLAMAEELRKNIDPYIAAGHAQIDEVIDPAETREAIVRGLRVSASKTVERPWRKHGVLPV